MPGGKILGAAYKGRNRNGKEGVVNTQGKKGVPSSTQSISERHLWASKAMRLHSSETHTPHISATPRTAKREEKKLERDAREESKENPGTNTTNDPFLMLKA